MKLCPKCGSEHAKTGAYCSRSCANSRNWTEESKRKRGDKLREYIANNPQWKIRQQEKLDQRTETLKKTLYEKNKERFLNGEMIDRGILKKWLIEIVGESCVLCKIGPEWQGTYLSLQVDHINGINNDNRFENIRLLCPNCHSQTDTFAGKKHRC